MRSWAGRLFAGTDNAPWYGLDPTTLETLGVEDMGGALAGANPLAHTRRDAKRNRLIAAAAAFDAFGDTTTTTFWEFDEQGHQISKVEDIDRSFVVHDYAITDEHYVLPISPIAFDLDNIPDFALGRAPATDLFCFDATQHGALKLVSRIGGETVKVDLGAFACVFHIGPCWLEDGKLIAHVLLCVEINQCVGCSRR